MVDAGLAIGWSVFAVILVFVSIGSYFFVRYMSDKYESQRLTTAVSTLTLICEFLALCIIPVDIYNVSSGDWSESSASAVKNMYYAAYITLFVFEFFLIPFAYFYFEEESEGMTTSEKICSAMKYTVVFVIVAIVLLVLALTLQFGSSSSSSDGYASHVLDTQHRGDAAITFLVACMATAGTLAYVAYGGFGMAAMPIGMVTGKSSYKDLTKTVDERIGILRAKLSQIEARYPATKAAISSMKGRDRKDYEAMRREMTTLSSRQKRLQEERSSFVYKISMLCAPFKKIFGVIIFIISLFVIISLGIATGDRAKNSSCGAECGYMTTKPSFTNPLDAMFLEFSKAFPLDYILLFGLLLLFFASTLAGLVRIGLRFFCIKLHKVRPRNTPPQGILLGCMIMTFVIITTTIQLVSFAPMYMNFGSQKNSHGDQCTLSDILKDVSESDQPCHMSEIGKFASRIVLNSPGVFGNIFFYTCWAYIAIFLISCVYVMLKGTENSMLRVDSSDEDEEWV
eukprot:ANDGO_05873.mRNA.1 putative lysosomal cobalamin transporter